MTGRDPTLAEQRLVELAIRKLPRYAWARPALDDYIREHGPLPPLTAEELALRKRIRAAVAAGEFEEDAQQ